MLLEVLSRAPENYPRKLLQLHVGLRVKHALLHFYVPIEHFLELLVDLKGDFSKFVVLKVILVANDSNLKQALAFIKVIIGGCRLPPQFNQSLLPSRQVFYLLHTYILKKYLACILPCLHLVLALP